MRPQDFDFELPDSLIAQAPAAERTDSRLLGLRRADGALSTRRFRDLVDTLGPKDLLVLLVTLVLTASLADLHLTGCEHIQDVRKLEGR